MNYFKIHIQSRHFLCKLINNTRTEGIMLFYEKLKTIMNISNCSSSDIIDFTHIDPSLLSRYKNGKRVPRYNCKELELIADSLAHYSRLNNKNEDVLDLIHTNSTKKTKSSKSINELINNWFHEEDSKLGVVRKYVKKQSTSLVKPYDTESFYDISQSPNISNTNDLKGSELISYKLNMVLDALNISSAFLAMDLSLETELINNYRSGKKTLLDEKELLLSITNSLVNHIKSVYQLSIVLCMLGLSENSIHLDETEEIIPHLHNWLLDTNEDSIPVMNNDCSQKINRFKLTNNPYSSLPRIPRFDDFDYKTNQIFYSTRGIRQAIIRFLSYISSLDSPRNIYIYTDQNTDWLTKDSDFNKLWNYYIVDILAKGNKIKIIHSLEQNLTDILISIENWLPLYMSGLIEPYYCSSGCYDPRFSHTILAAEDLVSISASYVSGTESHARYNYSVDISEINYLIDQFYSLRGMSLPLAEKFTSTISDLSTYKLKEIESYKSNTMSLLTSPSVCTMPESLIKKILDSLNLTDVLKNQLLDIYKEKVLNFMELLKTNQVTELCTLPTSKTLIQNKFKTNLALISCPLNIYYTYDDFKEHLENIIRLMKEFPNYKFIPIKHAPYKDIQFIIKKGFLAIALKTDDPSIAFVFKNPLMCTIFEKYFNIYSEPTIQTREKTIETLEEYLI